jgi:putative protein-disulfide isomerase
MTIIYCFDAYCGWCYGFSPVISQLADRFKDLFDFEVFAGGMILPDKPVHISTTAEYIRKSYPTVEERTGIKFGDDYLWHIFNPGESDWFPNSEKPSIALSVFKEYYPTQQVAFASDVQFALHFEGRDLCDDEAYRHLLQKYQLPENEFYNKLHDPVFKERAYYDFALVKQLQVTGYPTLLLQVSDAKFYLVTRGFADYDTVTNRLENILKEPDIQKN